MKTITTALLVLLSLGFTTVSFADIGKDGRGYFQQGNMGIDDGCCDRMVTLVTCRDNSDYRDAGLTVSVHSGGIAGMTMATVSRLTFAGTEPLNTVIVKRAGNPGHVLYHGTEFRLAIDAGSARNGYAQAKLRTVIKGEQIEQDMTCRLAR